MLGALFVIGNLQILLDLGFLEFNMLAHNWIIFGERELVRLGARILLGHIEIAGVSSGLQLDLDNIAFSHNTNSDLWAVEPN